MTLGKQAVDKLQTAFEKQREASPETQTLVFEDRFDNLRLRVEAADFDKYSYLLERLELSPSQAFLDFEALRNGVRKLTERVNCLLENLTVVEEDTTNQMIQLRSATPQVEDTASVYYEILVGADGRVRVERYRRRPEAPARERIPFQMTREVLQKLIDHLAALTLVG